MISVYNLLLTLDSISLLITVYLIKSSVWIPYLGICSIFLYFLIPCLLALFCEKSSVYLEKQELSGITSIELANDSYLPSYMGFFFIALSIPDDNWITFITVFIILFILLYMSQNIYYNPLFLLLGYHFYRIGLSNGKKALVITKEEFVDCENLSFLEVYVINDFSFIIKDAA